MQAPEQPGPSPTARRLPLAGDFLAAVFGSLGITRAVQWIARQLGRPCGCAARRELFNRLDLKARGFWGRLRSPRR